MERRKISTAGNDAGFTLIELLAVMLILALSFTLILPRLERKPSMADVELLVENSIRDDRLKAISLGQVVTMRPADLSHFLPPGFSIEMISDPESGVTFFPEGSTSGGAFLLKSQDHQLRYDLDRITGRVLKSAP